MGCGITRTPTDGYLVPFTEALLWVIALKDQDSRSGANAIDYSTDDGQRLRALAWARNFTAHQLIITVGMDMTVSGMLGVGVLGRSVLGGGGRLAWVDGSALPACDDDGKPKDRRRVYESLVAGHAIIEPLEAAQSYLAGLP